MTAYNNNRPGFGSRDHRFVVDDIASFSNFIEVGIKCCLHQVAIILLEL